MEYGVVDNRIHPPHRKPNLLFRKPIAWRWVLAAEELGRAELVTALDLVVRTQSPGTEPLKTLGKSTANKAVRSLKQIGLIGEHKHGKLCPLDWEPRFEAPKKREKFLKAPLSVGFLRRAAQARGQTLFAALTLIRVADMRKEAVPFYETLYDRDFTVNQVRIVRDDLEDFGLARFETRDRVLYVEPVGHRPGEPGAVESADLGTKTWVVSVVADPLDGNIARPTAVRALDVMSGRILTLAGAQLSETGNFWGDDDLVLTWDGERTLAHLQELGWRLPPNHIDVRTENRRLGNDGSKHWRDEADALLKERLRAVPTGQMVESIPGVIVTIWRGLGVPVEDLPYALHRGRYVSLLSKILRHGIPVDLYLYDRLCRHWKEVIGRYVERKDPLGLWRGGKFSEARFADFLESLGLLEDWPEDEERPGHLDLDNETLKEAERHHPAMRMIRHLLKVERRMSPQRLRVGQDGRARARTNPFGTKTGRDAPSSAEFLLNLPKMTRCLISPSNGMALARVDISSADFGIAAYKSGDAKMIEDYQIGPYIAFAEATLVLRRYDATERRNIAKGACLALLYRVGAKTLAKLLNSTLEEAQKIIKAFRDRYSVFERWCRQTARKKYVETRRGWGFDASRLSWEEKASVINFPIQSACAEIMRATAIDVDREGIDIIALHHDAIWVEAPEDDIQRAAESVERTLHLHSHDIIGAQLRVDTEIVEPGQHFEDSAKAKEQWDEFIVILEELEFEEGHAVPAFTGLEQASRKRGYRRPQRKIKRIQRANQKPQKT